MTRTANRPTTRPMPWDVMGSALTPKATHDLDKAMAETGLDYTVEVWDTLAVNPARRSVKIASPKAAQIVVPDGDGYRVVGSVGRRFTPIQNRDAFHVGGYLVAEFGAEITGLADFRSGSASLLALNLGQDVTLDMPNGGQDVVQTNLLVKNAHDGNSALTLALTPMRLACTNGLQAAIAGAERVWKVSHTPNAAGRIVLAETALKGALKYADKFQVAAQAMMDAEMVDAEFAKIVERFVPVKDDAEGAVADRKRETRQAIMDLYATSGTLEGIRGTRWGGYNALTEYLDHFRPVKGDVDLARAEGALEGPNVRVKASVWKMFQAA